MTYTAVTAILDGDAETRARYAHLVPNFERMKKLAVLMNKRREERGSIDFDLPEPVIEFDEQGQMRGVTKRRAHLGQPPHRGVHARRQRVRRHMA